MTSRALHISSPETGLTRGAAFGRARRTGASIPSVSAIEASLGLETSAAAGALFGRAVSVAGGTAAVAARAAAAIADLSAARDVSVACWRAPGAECRAVSSADDASPVATGRSCAGRRCADNHAAPPSTTAPDTTKLQKMRDAFTNAPLSSPPPARSRQLSNIVAGRTDKRQSRPVFPSRLGRAGAETHNDRSIHSPRVRQANRRALTCKSQLPSVRTNDCRSVD
jgi:hypothetical protein